MIAKQAIEAASDRVRTILKAVVVGESAAQASMPTGEQESTPFTKLGAIEPPYDPEQLSHIYEHSAALRPNVDSYVTNIDGFGHRLEPAIELEGEDADARIADVMMLEQELKRGDGEDDAPAEAPSEEQVAAERNRLKRLAQVERAKLEAFFEFCCFDHSFVHLRRLTRQDREVTGNAYWEVLRDGTGSISRFVYVPSHTVRLLPLDPKPVEVEERVRRTPVAYETVSAPRRLRRYVQNEGVSSVYFKAFGDPRVVSRKTGKTFESAEALVAADADDAPANELLHFAIHSPRSPYGVPRWAGTLLSVLGSRQSEEVNYYYFENKSVPPLALLVSGGRLSDKSIPRIERFIEENLKGRDNFHKILVLEAEGAANSSDGAKAKVELVPLTQAQQQDALFQFYDERNIDKVGGSFRLPRLLRGESKDFNRATAQSALRFAEDQVFAPERDEFDFMMNRRILPDMGIRFWRFRSQTPITRDPERLADMVTKLVRVGVVTPEEGRALAGDIFNREFVKIGDDWTKRPITLTLAGIQTGVEDLIRSKDSSVTVETAKRLLSVRDELAQEEASLAERRMQLARQYATDGRERVPVPAQEFSAWFETDDATSAEDA